MGGLKPPFAKNRYNKFGLLLLLILILLLMTLIFQGCQANKKELRYQCYSVENEIFCTMK